MPNALYPEMKPTPRNRLLGVLADALTAGRDTADKVQIPAAVPLVGGQGLGSLLLGKAPEEITEWSYGNAPLRINPLAGQTASFVPEVKPGRKQQLADALLAIQSVPGGPKMAAGLLGAMDTGAGKAAIVWHGSPHRFDRFDASKIGAGEGAQAYGHGLYFAESPDVAKSYMSAGGAKASSPPDVYAADIVGMMGSEEKALQHLKSIIPPSGETTFSGESRQLIEDAIKSIESNSYKQRTGAFYTVDIPDEMVGKMLDWDKPLSEQPKAVREAVEGIVDSEELYKGRFAPRLLDRRTTGGEVLEIFQQALGGPDVASNYLRGAGIPGIRYLDGGSRGTGAGTSNFVVFPGEENMLRILERNGMPLGR